jgi:hypothetical protein
VTDPQEKPAFYERRSFQGTVAVIGLLTAIWALVGAPKPWQVASELSATTVTLTNTEIVLDASARTAAPFGPGTVLRASQEAVARYVAPYSNEGFALRRAGGGCDESGEPLVRMGPDHSEDVRDAAFETRPAGKLNLGNAVRQAVDDFQASEYKAPQTTNRIVIFTSGEDECETDAAAEIREALAYSEVDVVTIFALSPSRSELKHLTTLRRAISPVVDHVMLRTPETKKQLDKVVKRVAVKAAKQAKAKEKAKGAKKGASSASSAASEQSDSGQPADDDGEDGQSSDRAKPTSGDDSSSSSSSDQRPNRSKRHKDQKRKRNSDETGSETAKCPEPETPTTTGEGTEGTTTTTTPSSEPEATGTGSTVKECGEAGSEPGDTTSSTAKKEGSTAPDETTSAAAPSGVEASVP